MLPSPLSRCGNDTPSDHRCTLRVGRKGSMPVNNIVEQDHRAVKRMVRPMLGFKTHRCARVLIAGIETMHMIHKGQMNSPEGQVAFAAARFYSLAF